ncbi:MAG TPA: bifunctional phosphoglucose/phosphomannose isomerase [Candidatus Saccharimonadales bacterium]|nr:bifunctional phosphoglucose/phosphomannose isomerase [Candidatus Saccharimonadales bacterium]
MLDDKNMVAQRDPQDALGFAAQQPEQLKHDFNIAHTASFKKPIYNIVFAGMGGSSLVAELARTWPELKEPFVICKEYNLPAFVDGDTLVIASSYSGNTEETLEALRQARQKGAQIAVITHGGKLLEDAKTHGDVLAEIPHCPQPRTSVFYAYRALVEIFVAAKLAPESAITELAALVAPLEQAVNQWTQEIPAQHNPAKQLAERMAGKTAIIYGGPLMYPAAYKWKIGVNENAKNTAWAGMLPEFNHNEFLGWSSHPVEKPFAVIDLLSSFEHPRVLRRFEVSDRMLSGMRPTSVNIEAKGKSVLEHLLYLVLFGDFTTTYLGILNGVDPTPVALVEKFKKELG